MKKIPDFPKTVSVSKRHPELISDDIFKDLEIPQRTQRPPSEELIERLNQLASKPPFSFIYKVRKNYPL